MTKTPATAVQLSQAGMRQSHTMPHAGGAQAFTLQQAIDDDLRLQTQSRGCDIADFLKQAASCWMRRTIHALLRASKCSKAP